MLSIERMRISSYINCLSDHFKDGKLVESMAFLIASTKGETLEFFAPNGDHVGYFDKVEDVKGECEEYVKLFQSYDGKTVKGTAVKLWYYYANERVSFTDEEKKLLRELGIKVV
jgi:hypothetical protein